MTSSANRRHPGRVLLEDFLEPAGLSQNRLAITMGVPARRINEIVLGKRRISPETAIGLASYFDTSPQFWLGLQADHDLGIAESDSADSTECREDRSGYLTVRLDPDVDKALRLKAALNKRSVSQVVTDALLPCLREDIEDRGAFVERAAESSIDYFDLLASLRDRGKL